MIPDGFNKSIGFRVKSPGIKAEHPDVRSHLDRHVDQNDVLRPTKRQSDIVEGFEGGF